MLSKEKKELISLEVIKTLYSRFENFPENSLGNRNAPFHEAFLNAFADKISGKVDDIPFFISLSSWLHGLNTTLGQSFFENIANILSDGQKKGFTKKTNNLLKITNLQKEKIGDIITDLKNANENPDLDRENALIFINNGDEIDANNFTADVYFEDQRKIVAIELKTVKPNAGEMRGEKQKILEGKSALYRKYPGKEILFFIGFPFDPTSENPIGSNKEHFLNSIIDGKKYFDSAEILLANELWDFLSGDKNTMQQILDLINSIATVDFQFKYESLNDSNTPQSEREKILSGWNLCRERRLLRNNNEILSKISRNVRLQRTYNQTIFNNGKYNSNRFDILNTLIKSKPA